MAAMNYRVETIPDGEAGTDATVKRMAELVQASLRRPAVRLKALAIINRNQVPNKDVLGNSSVLFEYVRRHVRYLPDPIGVETVQTPEATLELKAGDCDDHSVLLAALAASVGILYRFKVGGMHRNRFQHIYPELFICGNWLPADTTSQPRIGLIPTAFPVTKTFDLKGVPNMSIGLGATVQGRSITRPELFNVIYKSALDAVSRSFQAGHANEADIVGLMNRLKHTRAGGQFAEAPIRKALSHYLAHVKANRLVSPKRTVGLGSLDGFFDNVWGAVKGSVATFVPGGGAVVGAASGLFSKRNSGGTPVWNRVGPIKAGETLQAGGKPVDAKFAKALNASWQANMISGQKSGHIWSGAPAGAWEEARKRILAKMMPEPKPAITFAPNVRIPEGLIRTEVTPDAARAGVAEFLGSPMVLIGLAVAVGSFFLLKK